MSLRVTTSMGLFLGAAARIGIGALVVTLAHDIAAAVNRFSVRLYETFPVLKRLPRSELAGTQLNYKYLYYCLRIVGAVTLASGIVFLGFEMLRWK